MNTNPTSTIDADNETIQPTRRRNRPDRRRVLQAMRRRATSGDEPPGWHTTHTADVISRRAVGLL